MNLFLMVDRFYYQYISRFMGKLLIVIGLLVVFVGVLLVLKIPIPFGNLPGDFSFKTKHMQFYFPLASSLLVSLILSLLFYFFSNK